MRCRQKGREEGEHCQDNPDNEVSDAHIRSGIIYDRKLGTGDNPENNETKVIPHSREGVKSQQTDAFGLGTSKPDADKGCSPRRMKLRSYTKYG